MDAHKNFGYSTVAGAPAPATTGVSLTVQAGHGGRFPAVPFNATVWPPATLPLVTNAEIVRVTARVGDVLTLTRTQEGSTAHAILVDDQIAATITDRMLDDLATLSGRVAFALPTIASGFGTGPTIAGSSTLAFSITIGAGGVDDTGVLTFPAAPNGWVVQVNNRSALSSTTKQTGSTVTSATLRQVDATGTGAPWSPGDLLDCLAVPY